MAEWIKCEDKLPYSHNGVSEWSEEMVVLVRHSGHSDETPYYGVQVALYHTRVQQWFEDHDNMIGLYPDETVVAWQELPEPPPGLLTVKERNAAFFERVAPTV